MVKERIINGVVVRDISPDLTEEEVVERATYIVEGLQQIMEKSQDKKISTA